MLRFTCFTIVRLHQIQSTVAYCQHRFRPRFTRSHYQVRCGRLSHYPVRRFQLIASESQISIRELRAAAGSCRQNSVAGTARQFRVTCPRSPNVPVYTIEHFSFFQGVPCSAGPNLFFSQVDPTTDWAWYYVSTKDIQQYQTTLVGRQGFSPVCVHASSGRMARPESETDLGGSYNRLLLAATDPRQAREALAV